jgi:coenzyme PQQ synthesis protein D (PqqD)
VNDVIVARGARVAARKVAGEMVILSADDSSLYVLNDIGTAVWEALDGRTPLSAIVDDVVCREYAVERECALRDAHEFVAALMSHGVLVGVG